MKRVLMVVGLVLLDGLRPTEAFAVADEEESISVADESVTVRVVPRTDDLWFWSDTSYDYTTSVFVQNKSTSDVEVSAVLNGTSGNPIEMSPRATVRAGDAQYIKFSARHQDGSLRGGAFVEVTAGTSVVSVPAEVDILPNGTHYWWALTGSLTVAAIVVAALAFVYRNRSQELAVDSTWKFGDSWATNLTLVGATLTTVLGASGVLKELAPNLSEGRLVALNILFVTMALIAPMVYLAFARRDTKNVGGTTTYVIQGQKNGFLAAGFITAAAALGQVAIGALMVTELDTTSGTKLAIWLVLAAAVVAIVWYVLATAAQVIQPAVTPAGNPEPAKEAAIL